MEAHRKDEMASLRACRLITISTVIFYENWLSADKRLKNIYFVSKYLNQFLYKIVFTAHLGVTCKSVDNRHFPWLITTITVVPRLLWPPSDCQS